MTGAARNIALYPWFKVFQNLLFWQAVWFLYFQGRLSAAEAMLLYALTDIATTVLEVPSGYASDRWGRRRTLIVSAAASLAGAGLLALGDGFAAFAAGQLMMGAGMAFVSGTDSALLYESLAAEGREDEVEAQELRAWRSMFVALAVSAVTGGALALWSGALAYGATALAFAGMLAIALRFEEPRHVSDLPQGAELLRIGALKSALVNPVLGWLFALTVLMYVFSHLPFVFGQPFIEQALARLDLSAGAPLVSGVISAVMMVLSVLASFGAPWLRARLGLPGILLVAFAMQIALVAVLAATPSVLVIGLLLLRMVPDSLSRAFIAARIQPLLGDSARATYLSLQSLVGRLALSLSMILASGAASGTGIMAHAEIRGILGWFTAVGLAALVVLALAARRVPVGASAAP